MQTNNHLAAIKVAAFAVCAFAHTMPAYAQSMSPLGPTGTISAFPTIVKQGEHTLVTWDIKHPVPITKFITITEDGKITTKTELSVEIRVLGASSQYTLRKKRYWKTAEAEVLSESGSWSRFFRGTQLDVNPTVVCETLTNVPANTVLNFRGRNQEGSDSSIMNPWYTTGEGGFNVLTMGDGSLPPIWSGTASQRSPADFVKPYVDDNGTLALGPRDVIIFFELGNVSSSWGARDTQDLVLLVTFNDVKTTNTTTSTSTTSSTTTWSMPE